MEIPSGANPRWNQLSRTNSNGYETTAYSTIQISDFEFVEDSVIVVIVVFVVFSSIVVVVKLTS